MSKFYKKYLYYGNCFIYRPLKYIIKIKGGGVVKISNIITMVKGAPAYVKEHWNKPAEGEYLTLREMTAYTVSQAGTYIYSTVGGLMTFSASYFCGSIMGISNMDFYLINLATTILGYVLMFTNPVGMLIYENHGRLSKGMKRFAHISYLGQILIGLALLETLELQGGFSSCLD